MNRTAIDSESIAEVGYDEDRQLLEVLFRHGGLYQYFDVPLDVYEEFISAPSRGRYLVERIRSTYRYALVPPAGSSHEADDLQAKA